MNIFRLDKQPQACAQALCDQHVVKMTLETAQLLCGAHRYLDKDNIINQDMYKLTHINHQCSVWTRQSNNNYNWLYSYFIELCNEYTFRFGKIHKSDKKLRYVLHTTPQNIHIGYLTQMPFCMPEEYIDNNDLIQSYRDFYIEEKLPFGRWNNGRDKPLWIKEYERENK